MLLAVITLLVITAFFASTVIMHLASDWLSFHLPEQSTLFFASNTATAESQKLHLNCETKVS